MRVFIEPGFVMLLLASVTLFGVNETLCVLIAAAIHEMGHFAAIIMVGEKPFAISAGSCGFNIEYGKSKTYYSDILIAAAGPIMSLAAAFLCDKTGGEDFRFFTGVNAVFCLFNLLPLSAADGGRILFSLLSLLWGVFFAYKVMRWLNILLLAVLLCAGGYTFFYYKNPTMLLCCAVLIKEYCKSAENSIQL